MRLKVLKPGLQTTVQDRGRLGFQRYGVMVSGAMDPFAMRVANLLVGNPEGDAVLEMTLQGPTLEVLADVQVAVCGGDLAPRVDGLPVEAWRPLRLKEGSVLEFGRAQAGCRAYLAVAGGFEVPEVLGSRSTFLRAGLGGFEGRALKAGDVLPCGVESSQGAGSSAGASASAGTRSPEVAPWFVSWNLLPDYTKSPVIRVMRGRQFESFAAEARERFWLEEFAVTPQSDRMGYRLEGASLELTESLEMISEGVTAGTVQVPPDGKPIILLADRQTVGGYPKIAQVATVDLPLLAQLKPGDLVRFAEISVEEAQALYLQREQDLQVLKRTLAAMR